MPVLYYDAFAARPHQGNPAGVVLAGEGLDDATMQAVARAVGFNETAFVLPSARAEFRIRYFTPAHEVPLCGHATVATLVALRDRDGPGDATARSVVVETGAGLLPMETRVDAAGRPWVTMTQAHATFTGFAGDRAALAEALGVGAGDFHESLPIVYGSTGLWTLVVPLRSLDAVRRMQPRNAAFPEILREMPGASVHPFCFETLDPGAHLHARHFSSPRSGTVEDPVTGTASGVLGAYWRRYVGGQPPAPLIVEQGQEVGRDGRVLVWTEETPDGCAVRIAGTGCRSGRRLIVV